MSEDTNPSLSTFSGSGMGAAYAGDPLQLDVQAMTVSGAPQVVGGDPISFSVRTL